MARYSTSPHDVVNQATSYSVSSTSQSEGSTSPHDRATSPHDHKEKPKKKNPEEEPLKNKTRASQARTVFDFWKEVLNHPRAILDDKREKAISARLKDFSVEDLCLAIKGCAASPYHMGQNDRQEVYDDITLICRDVKHVEQFIAKAEIGSNGNGSHNREPRTASERNVRNIRESLEWINGVPGGSGAPHP